MSRSRIVRALWCGVVVAGLLIPPMVPSSALGRTDPDDTGGKLDLRRLSVVQDDASGDLTVSVKTWDAWSNRTLGHASSNRLVVDVDTNLDGEADVGARVVRSAGGLVAELRESGQVVERLPVERLSDHKMRFVLSESSIANPAGAVRLAAHTRFANQAACTPCADRAPDTGWLEVEAAAGGGDFTCTEVIGFSQTAQWYLDAPDFEDVVGSDAWQLLWQSGAAIDLWADPNFSGWSAPIESACADGSDAPDRVVLTISKQVFEDDVAVWTRDILAAVDTVGDKYPGVERIVLQPVVGGPGHQTCTHNGDPVRASVNHPVIDAAISEAVGGDVVAGFSPEVRTCDDYQDAIGHLGREARGPIGRTIAEFYAG
jgi:hypothetical protein